MKKTLFFSVIFALIAGCFSTSVVAARLYVGLQGGLSYVGSKQKVANSLPAPPFSSLDTVTYENHAYSDQTGVAAGLFFGVEQQINRIVLAAEIGASLDSSRLYYHSPQKSHLRGTAAERLQAHYGVALLPGIYLWPHFKVFGLIGFERGKFSSWQSALQLGALAALQLNPRWAIRIRYTYSDYQITTASRYISLPEGFGKIKVTTAHHPNNQQLLFGFSYTIC